MYMIQYKIEEKQVSKNYLVLIDMFYEMSGECPQPQL